MTRKRALGRGLDALIGARSRAQTSDQEVPVTPDETSESVADDATVAKPAPEKTPARAGKSEVRKSSSPAEKRSSAEAPITRSEMPSKGGAASQRKSPAKQRDSETSAQTEHQSQVSTASLNEPELSGSEPTVSKTATTDKTPVEQDELVRLSLGAVSRGRFQPRREFNQDRLEELAESIKTRGLMQPIVVRSLTVAAGDRPRYEIIAGERRWRAAQLAGLSVIPAIVRELDDEAALALALIENIQREDLNVVEESLALKRLMDEFELTQQQTAEAVGKSRTQVTNLLRLLSLEPEVLGMLERRELDVGHARALLALKGTRQRHTARDVVAKGLTVRQTEALVRRMLKPKSEDLPRNNDVAKLELQLGELLGASVKIDHGKTGKGSVSIKYSSLDELDGILSHIR